MAEDGHHGLAILARRLGDYGAISFAGSTTGGGSGPSSTGQSAAATTTSGPSAISAAPVRVAGFPSGFALVDLAAIDFSRSTVTSEADFSQFYTPTDLEWAFAAFEQVIMPTLMRGGSPDEFTERDARAGLVGTRSYSMTYSQFLKKNDAIKLTRNADGSYHIDNGQHRLWVAKRAGVGAVPALVT